MQRTDKSCAKSSGDCSMARTLDTVGDSWSMLILRDATDTGHTKFEEFRKSLGVAPNVLTKRLDGLCEAGMMKRHAYSQHPPRDEYVLTEKGQAFKGVITALKAFGDRWIPKPKPKPVKWRLG